MLHIDGPISYYKNSRGQIKWVKTPDGRTIENPSLSISRSYIPKRAFVWGLCLCLAVLAFGYFIHKRESIKQASWQTTQATIIGTNAITETSRSHHHDSLKKNKRYRAMLRFVTAAGEQREFMGRSEDSEPCIGQQRIVYYDPGNPADQSLDPPNPRLGICVGLVFGILFLIMGIAGQILGPMNKLTIVVNNQRWVWSYGKQIEGPIFK